MSNKPQHESLACSKEQNGVGNPSPDENEEQQYDSGGNAPPNPHPDLR